LFALDHNFSTRKPSRSYKVSKDLGFSLDSNKNYSEILPSDGLGPRSGEVGQGGLDVTHKKYASPNQENFFECRLEDLLNLEPLNSSLLVLAPELCSRKATCDPFFWHEILKHYWMQKI